MSWTDAVRAISERPEFQTSVIRIEDPSLVTEGEYDPVTNTWGESSGDPVLYEGQARIIPVRDGSFTANDNQANPTTLVPIRVQIPRDASTDIRIRRGCKVFVVSAPDALHLTDRLFTISSDLQGSSAGARTFEAMADVDAYLETSGYGETEALRDGYGE